MPILKSRHDDNTKSSTFLAQDNSNDNVSFFHLLKFEQIILENVHFEKSTTTMRKVLHFAPKDDDGNDNGMTTDTIDTTTTT